MTTRRGSATPCASCKPAASRSVHERWRSASRRDSLSSGPQSARRRVGETFADRGCELEAVAGTRRTDEHALTWIEDKALVFGVRVQTRLGADRCRVDVAVSQSDPVGDAFEELRVRLAGLVRVDLDSGVVDTGLQSVLRIM